MKRRKKRVIIAHGWGDPANAWIDWLAGELEARGFEVVAPLLPNPKLPRLVKWVETLREAAGILDRDTVLVAHSLGTPTVLRLLDDYPEDVRIAGVVLVAGFGDGVFEKPGALFAPPLNFERITARAKTRVCIYSDNDRVVSPRRSEQLARWLKAREVIVLGGGHFFGSKLLPSSISRLPVALEAVLSCYPKGFWERLADRWRRLFQLGGYGRKGVK